MSPPDNLILKILSPVVLVLAACSADNTGPPVDKNPVVIEVSRYAVTLPPTTDTSLTATISGTDINEPITWTSSAPSVATIRDDGPFGVVHAVAEGTTTVYAVRKSDPRVKSPPVHITVMRVPALRGFTVDTVLQQFIKGDSRTFALNPSVAEARAVVTYVFTSSNVAVATVNSTTGVVTAVGSGNATITAAATGVGSGLITNTLSATAQVLVGELQLRSRRITAGAGHTCTLKATGEALCWGSNSAGQLGDGTLVSRAVPMPVVGGFTFTEISAGFAHTCGLTTAGAVYCWGINSQGRLGDGTTTTRLVPTLARSPVPFVALEVGGVHTCAVTAAGVAYCWGDIAGNQPANGVDLPTSLPKQVQLPGGAVKTITTGLLNTCVTSAADVGYCWGGVTVSGNTLIPNFSDSATAIGMYGFGQNIKCVLSIVGRVYCPIGNGGQRLIAMPNAGPPFPYILGVVLKSLVAGDAHMCGLNLRNELYCWGTNLEGRVGSGNTAEVNALTLVVGGFKFAEAAAGEAHTCGLTTTNQVYCWGNNLNGQLGSAGASSSVPKLVPITP